LANAAPRNFSPRDDLSPPVHFEVHTSYGSQIVLNNRTGMPKHAACALFVVAEAGDILSFKDGAGATSTITFTGVPFVGTIRGTFTTIETATTCVSVTAAYMSDPG
jgi:hypothetical protein